MPKGIDPIKWDQARAIRETVRLLRIRMANEQNWPFQDKTKRCVSS